MSSKPLNASRRTALLALVAATVAACATTDSGKPPCPPQNRTSSCRTPR